MSPSPTAATAPSATKILLIMSLEPSYALGLDALSATASLLRGCSRATISPAAACQGLRAPRVDDGDVQVTEIFDVARRDGQASRLRRARDEGVAYSEDAP